MKIRSRGREKEREEQEIAPIEKGQEPKRGTRVGRLASRIETEDARRGRYLHIIGFIHSIPVLNILIMNLISKTELMFIHVAIILSSVDRDSFAVE